MLSFSLVAEALKGLIYHRPSGENFSSAAQLRSQDLPNMARDHQEDLSSATVLVYKLASGKAINSQFFGYCRLMNVEYG